MSNKPTGRHKVTLGDEEYVFDERELTLSDAFAIKAASGLNLQPFMRGLNDGDPVALQTLVWFLRQKHDRPEDIRHIDFRLADLVITELPDPTEPADETSSETAETATSDSSPTSAT